MGVAIRKYPTDTDTGPADYILFVNKKPVGAIEAKRDEEGVRTRLFQQARQTGQNAATI